MGAGRARRSLRLSGEVGGRHHTFALEAGDNEIGSAAANRVVLLDRSVSRHHAVLRLAGTRAEVRDQGSTNGTFVGTKKVRRATVRPGQLLRFGSVALRLEAIDPEDAELALEMPPPSGGPPPLLLRAGETTRVSRVDSRERGWLYLAEAVARMLAEPGESPLTTALERLRGTLGVAAVALLELEPGGEPAVRSSAGETGALPDPEELRRALERLEREPGEIACSLPKPRAGGLTLALLSRAADRVGLAIAGPYEGRGESRPLLSLLLRILSPQIESRPRRSSAAGGEGRNAPGGLRFPRRYVPGISPAMVEIYARLESVLPGGLPTLIHGETGVGKEPIAAILHANSPQKEGPLVAINCAAIPSDLLEAELFGVARGAATGVRERRGKFLEAQGGSLLLDEIGELELPLQAKLLRALQEREVTPVGGRPESVDARIIATTNRDLRTAMTEGLFRDDLYYRLAGCVLEIPPLRRRREDIPALLQHFLDRYSLRSGKALRGVTLKALRALTAYGWPGNVRELQHEARRLALLCENAQMIDFPLLSAPIRETAE